MPVFYRCDLEWRMSVLFNRNFHDLNRLALLALREAGQQDRCSAKVTFGVDDQFLDEVLNMGLADIERVAESGVVLFSPRCSSEVVSHLKQIGSQNERILLASLSASSATTIPAEA